MMRTIRVLYVDDDPTYGDLVETFLTREDAEIEVVTATDAKDGLDILSNTGIDCIVADYFMPGMDGLDMLQAVKARSPALPFILFTSGTADTEVREAIATGLTDYVEKHIKTDPYAVLANRIRQATQPTPAMVAA